MARVTREIGESREARLLADIANKLDKLIKLTGQLITTTITTTIP